MMKSNTSWLLVLSTSLFCFGSFLSAAQPKQAAVIQKAMDDELKRNMSELAEEGFEKPFYIGYGLTDLTTYSAMATMGGLLHSVETPSRTKAVRVLVGTYELNDESLDDTGSSSSGLSDIDLPLDADYYGIRRGLWITTDQLYKSAARQLKKNAATVTNEGKSLAEIPHRTFGKAPAVQLFIDNPAFSWDAARWESYVREVSSVFKAYPEVAVSTAALTFQQGSFYFVNSEGTHARTSRGIAALHVTMQIKNSEGEISFDQISHFARTPDRLPDVATMKAEAKAMADQLMANAALPNLDEEYTGPVMLEGPAVAEVLSEIFFAPREGLQANNVLPDPKHSYRNDQSMDTKIGKLVAGESLTVKDKSPMKTYHSLELLGAYDVDQDGVAPPAEVVLIEKGILKNLLNDRTITKPDQTANGHRSGPGVIEVVFDQAIPTAALKDKLLQQLKKEAIPFGIILRDYSAGKFNKVYKVTPDGKEEELQSAALKYIPMKSLKKVIAASSQSIVCEMPSRSSPNGVVSYIVPDGIVFEEATVAPGNPPVIKETVYVTSPLGNN